MIDKKPTNTAQACTYDTMQLYKDLQDLWAEANAVDTVIGRPDVLMRKITKMRDEVGKVVATYLPLGAAPQQEAQEPMFWVRLCSDGLYEGPIHNARIEDVRKQSGVWSPLYLGAPQPAPARLTKPAKVGNGTFCAGVHERRVIEAAQRQYEIFTTEPEASHEERMAQERARRNLWDMLHGPLPTSSNDPALPTRPQVADTLLAEVAGNFTREVDLPNDLLGRIDAYLTSEGYTE